VSGDVAKKDPAVAQDTVSIKQAAEDLGVTVRWIRTQIAAGLISPARAGSKRNGRFVLSAADVEILAARSAEDPSAGGAAMLARFTQLEGERANLLAQVAWERAIAQEQQKALEAEHARVAKLIEDLEAQRVRVEQLKALSAWDRVLGRHKSI
jgi:DNA-binding transcriptional MerR regulator